MSYSVRFVTYALDQWEALSPAGRAAIDVKIRELEEDPFANGQYDQANETWSSSFGDGMGVILYLISEDIVMVTVLRLAWMGD